MENPTLSRTVSHKFRTAKATGKIVFSPTRLEIIYCNGVPYQLRYCPALSKKPLPSQPIPPASSPRPSSTPPETLNKKPNPFLDPPLSLLIQHTPPNPPNHRHNLILNKYPVIPKHFILATKEYKAQTDLLEEDDLEATWKVLHDWEADETELGDGDGDDDDDGKSLLRKTHNRRLFAFFNSGDFSGASQGHRHLQFLPVEGMRDQELETLSITDGQDNGVKWRPLIDLLDEEGTATEQKLPFQCFHTKLSPGITSQELLHTYLDLYHKAVAAIHSHPTSYNNPNTPSSPSEKPLSNPSRTPSEIGYNLAMTKSTMVICPRRSEGLEMKALSDGKIWKKGDVIGKVELNGTILAGTLMVKNEIEWDYLRGEDGEAALRELLGEIGIRRNVGSELGKEDRLEKKGQERL